MVPSDNKRIVKNTFMLYIRMMFSMLVSLYTSRVVLNTLGVEDYGIYGVVGGIVVLFSFLNATMSGATSRFLTFELGKNNIKQLKQTFNCALIVHIGIALIVLFLAETIGLWFLNEKLNIPDDRIAAAQWVYQLSVLSSMISITQVPYNASLISHERMDIYAYVEILNTTLKLVIVYILQLGNWDKLILYALLTLFVSILIASTYRFYCLRMFRECHFHWKWDKTIGKSLFSFSSWNLYSNLCFTTRQQGTNMLLNIFGGIAVNAASGLATTVQFMIEQFSTNLVMASRPQIIKLYSTSDYGPMINLMQNTALLANLLYIIVAIPFIAEIEYIFKLWLINVPEYTTGFCICLIVSSYISLNTNIIYIGIQAVGKMKFYSVMAGSVSLSVIPILWILFETQHSLYWAYTIPIISNMVIYVICGILLNKYVGSFRFYKYVITTMLYVIMLCIPMSIVIFVIHNIMKESLFRVVLSTLVSSIILMLLVYTFILPLDIKRKIKQSLQKYINNGARNFQ